MRKNLPDYKANPEVVAFIQADDRFLRACANLAEVLDLHPQTVERLAFEPDFIAAVAELSSAKVVAACRWQRSQAAAQSGSPASADGAR